MTDIYTFSNNASALLASGISDSDTQVTVEAGYGALFPAFSSGQIGMATLEDVSGNLEVVEVTGRTSDTMTIVRHQEGTEAIAFASGSRFELRITAGVLSTMLQKTGGDTLSGTTTNNGVIQQNTSGSVQGGEIAGAYIRGSSGETDNQLYVPSAGAAPTIGGSTILTASNIVGSMPSGAGVVVSGMVLLWSGASNAIPAGYVLCDGTNSTPDLRDCFVLGGGGSLATSGGSSSTGSAGAHAHGGNTGAYALTAANMPSGLTATLGFTYTHIGSADGGSGTGTVLVCGNSSSSSLPITGGSGAAHQHTIASDGSHTHTCLPPYKALFYIMKT